MKKIKIFTILILFLFSCAPLSVSQKILPHPSSHPYECAILDLIVKEYVCDTNVLVLFNGYELLSTNINGITNRYSENIYQISINYYTRDFSQRLWTLLHEAGHLIDMSNGDLKTNPYYWKGERISSDTPYHERPWEISAENWARILFFSIVVDTIKEEEKSE